MQHTEDPIPHEAIEMACAVLRHAAETGKYLPRGYVDACSKKEGNIAYFCAENRHETRWRNGELVDKDGGYHPLAYRAARCLCRLQSIIERGEPK